MFLAKRRSWGVFHRLLLDGAYSGKLKNKSAILLMTMKSSASQFRKKRSDTRVGTIEKRYGKDLGVRSDKKLGTYLKERGYRSLSELLKNE